MNVAKVDKPDQLKRGEGSNAANKTLGKWLLVAGAALAVHCGSESLDNYVPLPNSQTPDGGVVNDAGKDGSVTDSGTGGADSGVKDGGVDAGETEAGPDATPDSGTADSGMDSGVVDSGAVDSGIVDSGMVDSGTVDSGSVDSGVVDSGVADSGVVDSGVVDSGVVDSGVVDSGVDSGGSPCPGVTTGTVNPLLLQVNKSQTALGYSFDFTGEIDGGSGIAVTIACASNPAVWSTNVVFAGSISVDRKSEDNVSIGVTDNWDTSMFSSLAVNVTH